MSTQVTITPIGRPGANGRSFLTGMGNPTAVLGRVGDSYCNLLTGEVWQYRAAGWTTTGEFIVGREGTAGREVELQTSATHVQWRWKGEPAWINLVSIEDLRGKSVELQKSATHLQWRVKGDPSWTNLVLLTDIAGPPNVLELGTVTDSDDEASVTITGTSPKQVINFVLRRGRTGTVTPELTQLLVDTRAAKTAAETAESNAKQHDINSGTNAQTATDAVSDINALKTQITTVVDTGIQGMQGIADDVNEDAAAVLRDKNIVTQARTEVADDLVLINAAKQSVSDDRADISVSKDAINVDAGKIHDDKIAIEQDKLTIAADKQTVLDTVPTVEDALRDTLAARDKAQEWAISETAVEPDKFSAKYWAERASENAGEGVKSVNGDQGPNVTLTASSVGALPALELPTATGKIVQFGPDGKTVTASGKTVSEFTQELQTLATQILDKADKIHTHEIANITGLQSLVDTLVVGVPSVTNASVPMFDGTGGKAIKSSGYTVAGLLDRANHTGTMGIDAVDGLSSALAGKTSPADVRSITGGSMTGRANPKMADGSNLNVYWTDDTPFPYPASPPYIMGATTKGEIYATLASNLGISTAIQAALDLKASLALATTAEKGLMSPAQFDKLNGVQAGAQVNPNMALYQTNSLKGQAGGYAGLDGTGKVPTGQLPDVLFGSVKYQTSWNAATNTPAIPAAAEANRGWYYMVSADGSTPINGTTEWVVGDWLVSNGSRWDRIKNTDAVFRVAGLQGDITVAALQNALGLKSAAYQDASAFAPASVSGQITSINASIVDLDQRVNAGGDAISTLTAGVTDNTQRLNSLKFVDFGQTQSLSNAEKERARINIAAAGEIQLSNAIEDINQSFTTMENKKVNTAGQAGLGRMSSAATAMSGVIDLETATSNYITVAHTGSTTIKAPIGANAGNSFFIVVTIGAGAATLALSGFSLIEGDNIGTVSGKKYYISIARIGTESYVLVKEKP